MIGIPLSPRLLGGIALAGVLAYVFRDPLGDMIREHREPLIKYGGTAVLAGVVGRQLGLSYGSTPGEWVSRLLGWIVEVVPLVS